MTRPRKQTVDYFPHSCDHGETMFILEERYGNDGYAFWFKLLELLGKNQGHFLNLEKISTLEFLASKTRIAPDTCVEILNLLARLEAIHPELWESKIVWSDNFVTGIADAYRNRVLEIPKRPDNLRKKSPELPKTPETNDRKPHTRLKETTPPTPPKGGNGVVPFLKVQESWNRNAPPLLPRIKVLDEKRKRLIKAAWQEHPELLWFDGFFRDIALSDHHSGKNDKGWVPDISWILKERVRLQEKFDSLKDAHAPPGVGQKPRSPTCSRCRGSGLYKSGETPDHQPIMSTCDCDKNGPHEPKKTDPILPAAG